MLQMSDLEQFWNASQKKVWLNVVYSQGNYFQMTKTKIKNEAFLFYLLIVSRPNGNTLCAESDEEVEFLQEIDCEEDISVSKKVS